MIKKHSIIFILVIFIFSCNQSFDKKTLEIETTPLPVFIEYANNFAIKKANNYTILEVLNPWQGADNVKYIYYLSNKKEDNLDNNLKYIQTPIKKAVCLSTTHIGFLDLLDKTNTIIGVSGANFIYNPKIQKRIASNKILDVGYEQNLNIELIISLKPDVVFVFGVQGSIANKISELEKLGISVVIVAEYLEEDPLGKAEWIKFFAEFYEQEEFAKTSFNEIVKEYNNLSQIADTIKDKTGVLVNIPYQGVWYIPGGNSYFAKLINDAGGNYLWKENSKNESYPISFESVFVKQKDADILINPSSVSSVEELLQVETRLSNFNCIKNKEVYNNNLRTNISGGNDFWESAVVNPHIVLKDLITIFYPGVFDADSLFYYQKLN